MRSAFRLILYWKRLIVDTNAGKIAEYRGGKGSLLGLLVGLAINAGKGGVDPAQMNEMLKHRLAGWGRWLFLVIRNRHL